MYIDIVPNRKPRPAVFLRESYRENGTVKKRTILNPATSAEPPHKSRFISMIDFDTLTGRGQRVYTAEAVLPLEKAAASLRAPRSGASTLHS